MRRRCLSALAAVAVLVAVPGCGGDGDEPDQEARVKKALRDTTRAVRERDAATFCSKLFPSTALPIRLARRLDVPEGGEPSSWGENYRECSRDYRNPAAFRDLGPLPNLKGAKVSVGPPITGMDRITRTAPVTLPRSRGEPAKLVEFRGDWKLVIGIN